MENLHPDITSEILYRVPIDSLFQCKGVCKTWRSLSRHVIKSRLDYEGCSYRTSLDVRRRESRVQIRGHLQNPWSDFPHILEKVLRPYIDEGFVYAAHTECKKAVQVELDMMKSICNHVDSELDKLKLVHEDAGRLCFRARKELHTMDGIEELLNSDDINIPPDTCWWLVKFQMNPYKVKAFLDYVEREESELKCQHQMEESRVEDQKGREEKQLKDQTKVEENEPEKPEDKKERVRFLIEQIHSALLKISDIKDIVSCMSIFREQSRALYIRLKGSFEWLSNHVCQDKEHKQGDKESEQSTRPQKKRRLFQETNSEIYREEDVPFFAMGRLAMMIV